MVSMQSLTPETNTTPTESGEPARSSAKTKPIESVATESTSWIHQRRMQALLCLVTLALMSLIFAPISYWPIAFICLVPWLVVVGASHQAPRVYFYSYLMAVGFFLLNMRWMYEATGWGYLALTLFSAIYFPFVAIVLRHVIRRRRLPLVLFFPVVWVGCEMVRGVFIAGFPWFFLSHSFYQVLTLIQVSDLVGAYGVTFMACVVNGFVADVILNRFANKESLAYGVSSRGLRGGAVVVVVTVLFVVLYGKYQLTRDTGSIGPKIAIIQGDYRDSAYANVLTGHDNASYEERKDVYFSMLQAASSEKPDLYVLPESPWVMCLNLECRDFNTLSRQSFLSFERHATSNQAMVVTGSATSIVTPNDLHGKVRRYNSATIFKPDGSEPDRYDKVHLVLFGEYIPFRFGRFRFLYFWLNWVMPFSGPNHDYEYSSYPGAGFKRFEIKPTSSPEKAYHFGIPICYEDVMPYVSRAFVAGGAKEKQVDFLLNISNDGWFGRAGQQPQHLAICAFRAVENRVGIARAVNTGVSAFIQPSGEVRNVVRGDSSNPWPGICNYQVAHIGIDSRFTFYSQHGDWFAWGCVVVWGLVFFDYWIMRVRERLED